MSTVNYNRTTDFSSGVNITQFYDEIVADPTITTPLDDPGVTLNGDIVSVFFTAVISGAEQTALDNLVANHVPVFSDAENIINDDRINIESTLADNQAIIINASDPAGGIVMMSGTGSTSISSSNAILLTGGAQSEFETTMGNLVLTSAGLINAESAGGGFNIGTNAVAQTMNLGTGSAAKTINIGNSTGNTLVDILTGTGGFLVDTASGGGISLDATGAPCNFSLTTNGDTQDLMLALTGATNSSILLESSGTGADAIGLSTSAGGIQMSSTGQLNLVGNQVAGGAITLDTASGGGGITLSSGSFGIIMQVMFGGAMSLGNDSGTGDVNLGTGARARAVAVGSTTTTSSTTIQSGTGGLSLTSTDQIEVDATGVLELNSSGGAISIGNDAVAQNINLGTAGSRTIDIGSTSATVAISSGTGGITIGNNANTGDIQIGNVSNDKTIILSNNSSNTRLITRWGNSANIKSQVAESAFGDFNSNISAFNIRTGILTMTPTADRTLTLPTSSTLVADYAGFEVGDALDFSVINNSTPTDEATITVATNTGWTLVGNMDVSPRSDSGGTYFTSGSGLFRVRITNVGASTESATLYRLA